MSLSLKATQADGYYQPPDHDSKRHGTLNKIYNRRGGRGGGRGGGGTTTTTGRTIRFEMPFKVWCLGCDEIIAKGVRFDAEKKIVGYFHSTPILEFSMTCLKCRAPIIIRTDPETTEYICHAGCRLRIESFDPEEIGQWKFRSVEELKEIEANPLLQVQARVMDVVKSNGEDDRLKAIIEINEKNWADDVQQNSQLRKSNRAGRGPLVNSPGNRNFILPEEHLDERELASIAKKFKKSVGPQCKSERAHKHKLRKLAQKVRGSPLRGS